MDTWPHPNGYTIRNTHSGGIGVVLLVMAALAANAQDDAYKAVLKIAGGGPPLVGFLYAVNDTAVVILPTSPVGLGPRGLVAAQENNQPISIPSKLIKKLRIAKVRTVGHYAGVVLLLTFTYATTFALLIPIDDPAELLASGLVSAVLTGVTVKLIYWRTHRPTEPGFMMRMQEYCLKQDGLMVDR